MPRVRLALAQLACIDGEPVANLARLEATVAAQARAHDLIVFPESFLVGFPPRDRLRALAEPLDGPLVQRLAEVAREADATLAVGLAERDGSRVYNTTVLVSPEGVLLAYRKTHLWVFERPRIEAGDAFFCRPWQGVPTGLLICYDLEFPETARAVASMGAELLVVTNGNMDPYGPVHRVALQARAQENHLFAAMANRVGNMGEIVFCGGSAVADPKGRIVAEAGRDEEILSVEIDTEDVAAARRAEYNYLRDRRVTLGLDSQADGCGTGVLHIPPTGSPQRSAPASTQRGA